MANVGRPRLFDVDLAVDHALVLFWEHGYEATSLAQLRYAMEISSASFYAAFGSKEALFARVLDRYMAGPGTVTAVVGDTNLPGREAVARLLHGSIRMQTALDHPLGCLIAMSARMTGEATPGPVLDTVMSLRRQDRLRIEGCIERAIEHEELRSDTDMRALAGAFYGFLLGVSTQARDGADAADLHRAADAVLLIWDAHATEPVASRAHSPT